MAIYIYIYGEKCERVVKGEGCWSGVGIHGPGLVKGVTEKMKVWVIYG